VGGFGRWCYQTAPAALLGTRGFGIQPFSRLAVFIPPDEAAAILSGDIEMPAIFIKNCANVDAAELLEQRDG
jgi:hypothetical protein